MLELELVLELVIVNPLSWIHLSLCLISYLRLQHNPIYYATDTLRTLPAELEVETMSQLLDVLIKP